MTMGACLLAYIHSDLLQTAMACAPVLGTVAVSEKDLLPALRVPCSHKEDRGHIKPISKYVVFQTVLNTTGEDQAGRQEV